MKVRRVNLQNAKDNIKDEIKGCPRVGRGNMAASWRFQSVCEEDLDKVLNDKQVSTKVIKLFALDFCVIVDSGCTLVKYGVIKIARQ